MAVVTIEDRLRAAQSADPEALVKAIGILRQAACSIEPDNAVRDVRRMKLFSAMAHLQQQLDDACRFLMGDALL